MTPVNKGDRSHRATRDLSLDRQEAPGPGQEDEGDMPPQAPEPADYGKLGTKSGYDPATSIPRSAFRTGAADSGGASRMFSLPRPGTEGHHDHSWNAPTDGSRPGAAGSQRAAELRGRGA